MHTISTLCKPRKNVFSVTTRDDVLNLSDLIMGSGYDNIGEIQVVAFSGRESDAPFGIWGSIADQLGKKDAFAGHYAPLGRKKSNNVTNA